MNDALTRYPRRVLDDGLIGSELVVALLAIYRRPSRRCRFIRFDDPEDEDPRGVPFGR